ncbi:MAG TPA: glycosyl hydrolase family 28 protein [Terracidiphilus sp.]|jgi:polygalacturonase|nr:glycosyl hydrolase family 28 protein [Terracidiphilus sp.]
MLRRDFLSASPLVMGLATAGVGSASPLKAAKSILDYGARPGGKKLNTKAIQRAIDDVFTAGGGLVYAPPGTFLIGGIELKSRVTLYLEAGCVLLGSTSIDDYDFHPGPHLGAAGDANGHHLIFAQNADDVTLCGLGTIDGQGQAYWEPNPNHTEVKPEDAWKDGASHYYRVKNHNRRPSPMVEFAQCRNVRLSGVTLKNSAGWTLRPVACETVVIDGIRIRNPLFGVNCDGLDITASRNVFVSNCDIITGDDAICIKSMNPYGDVLPTKNITVTNCTLTTSCNGFKLGTSSEGAFENIVFSNSVIYSNVSPVNERVEGGINVEVVDGGSADGILVSNIRMQNVRAPIFVRLGERKKKEGTFLRNVLIEGVDAEGAIVASSITGVPGLRPSDISVSNCRIRTVAQGHAAWAQREIPEVTAKYPQAQMMGRLPAYGFYVRHADRVRLRNVECIADVPDGRPAIVCDDVNDAIFSGLELSAPAGGAPVFDLRDTQRAFLTGMRSPAGTQTFAQISGAASSEITLLGNSIEHGQKAVSYFGGATGDSTAAQRQANFPPSHRPGDK